MTQYRSISELFTAHPVEEGDLKVNRAHPSSTCRMGTLDPFLLLDHLGPYTLPPGYKGGIPAHPHRGFQVISYVLQGTLEHLDSLGNHGITRPGEMQWMTAGAGIVHSEYPEKRFSENGGTLESIQIWVNLPQKKKMIPPGYQHITHADMPRIELQNNTVNIHLIAGELFDHKSPIQTLSPLLLSHLKLTPETEIDIPIPKHFMCATYILKGSIESKFHPKMSADTLIKWENEGTHIHVASGKNGLDLLLLSGQPLGEPLTSYGPFVMTTLEEIEEAVQDYQTGRMGSLSM